MALRLAVVSENAARLGEKATKVFGVHGGTIGRATENEWTLPDPERYLSGTHARVEFRAGKFLLVDTSSNGTYVNGAQVPLGRFHEYTMKDGDYIRIGEYELLVSIDPSNDFPPDEGAIVAYDGSQSSAARKSTANDIGADLDLSELLEPSNNLDAGRRDSDAQIIARNAYGQAATPLEDPLQMPQEPAPAAPWHMMTRPLSAERAAAPLPRAPAAAVIFDDEVDSGLAAFCRGAGIDPRTLPPECRSTALQRAGQLLREAVLGLMDLNQSGNEFRNRLRIPAPAADDAPSTVHFTHGVDETVLRLLATLSARAGSVEAMRENFRGLKAQNAASLAALGTALDEFLARFAPKELAERFDRGIKRGHFGAQNKGKYWDMYAELYPSLAQRPAEGFPHLFLEAFARAYQERLQALNPPRRGSLGADGAAVDVKSTGGL
ncbi:MAG TPA: type VI secretion system-associated FHA domain protein TagH [Steroidobacteraceae bacterium]|nr:type VI secretion system-associated FHA domain protein TagH [Steroidobacteraceae bacterium]